jgi:nitrite reductase (NADH) small subunit
VTLLEAPVWTGVCPLSRLTPDRGVAALVDGRQVAVFVLAGGEVHAIDNRDPFSGANVLSRGIVGDKGGAVFVAAPVYKQRFELASGTCLDEPSVSVAVHDVRVVGGEVEVRLST